MPRMKKIASFLWKHKAAFAKLLLSVLALLIILFLPLRSVPAVPDNSTLHYIEKRIVVGIDYSSKLVVYSGSDCSYSRYLLNVSDVMSGDWIALESSMINNCSIHTFYVPLNISLSDFVKYGVKMCIRLDLHDISSEAYYAIAVDDGGSITDLFYINDSTCISYIDLAKYVNHDGRLLIGVEFSDSNAIDGSIEVSGNNLVKVPLYTAITHPIATVFSTIWGTILGLIRRVRSVMNSALGGFWSYFGISAFTGNVILSLALAALIIYLVHYRHILRPRKR